jgi:hypothetical protein
MIALSAKWLLTAAAFSLSLGTAGGSFAREFDRSGGSQFDFHANLHPEQEVRTRAEGGFQPANLVSNASGEGRAKFEGDLSSVRVRIRVTDLSSPINAGGGHIHCGKAGQNGGVVLPLNPTAGVTAGKIVDADFTSANLALAVGNGDCVTLCGINVSSIAALRFAAAQGCLYFNVHTATNPQGEIRGQLLLGERDD